MNYVMRGYYTLELLAYGIRHRGVQLVEIVKASLAKYLVKDRSHGTSLIKLYPVSCCQSVDLWEIQKYSYTPGTQKKIQRTNFFKYVCLEVMSSSKAESPEVNQNLPTGAPQISTVVQ